METSRWSKTEKKKKKNQCNPYLLCLITVMIHILQFFFFPSITSKPELVILNSFFLTPYLGDLEKWKPDLNHPSFFKTRMWGIRNFPKFYAAIFIRNCCFPKQSTNLWMAIESPIFPVRIFSNESLLKNGMSFWDDW